MAFAFNAWRNPSWLTGNKKQCRSGWKRETRRASGQGGPPPKAAPKSAQKPAKVRQRNWAGAYTENPDGYDDLDIESTERVMPKGETEWRNAKVIRSPLHEGVGASAEPPFPAIETGDTGPADAASAERVAAGGMSREKGTVVEVSTGLCSVDTPEGRYLCSLRKSLRVEHSGYSNMIAVGDHVVVSHNGHRQGIVEAILPRRSALARPDPDNIYKQQIIVANVDQLLIVAAWRNPGFWPELVDRYLIGALRNNLAPIIAINKVDLAEERYDLEGVAQAYQLAGCRVILTSATTGAGWTSCATRCGAERPR